MTPMMLRHFPTTPWEGLDAPSAAMLLGIKRDPGPPVVFGPHRFERLRIVIIDRDPTGEEAGDDFADADGDADEPEILPQIPLLRRGLIPPSRPVHGEILRGEDGALYERFGQRIRPLRALASGPRGEVLEVATAPVAKPQDEPRRSSKSEGGKPAPEEPAAPPAPEAPPPFRALFPTPGHWRVVRFGDFRPALTPQLAHPARLRDTHWLPCHVQVFETTPPPSREALAAQALGDASLAAEIFPLTPALIHTLQLAAVLPPPIRGSVRFLHLELAHDPSDTEETATPPAVAQAAAPAPAAAPAAPTPPPAPVAPAAPAPKTEIPAAFASTAPYVLSREAAYTDLVADDHIRPGRFQRWFGGPEPTVEAHALREWQLQLSGRSLDEQLWAVPPPEGWRRDGGVRTWAAQALERGGYAPAMLPEWRLYWRRRGC